MSGIVLQSLDSAQLALSSDAILSALENLLPVFMEKDKDRIGTSIMKNLYARTLLYYGIIEDEEPKGGCIVHIGKSAIDNTRVFLVYFIFIPKEVSILNIDGLLTAFREEAKQKDCFRIELDLADSNLAEKLNPDHATICCTWEV